jgi:hypothetical protein
MEVSSAQSQAVTNGILGFLRGAKEAKATLFGFQEPNQEPTMLEAEKTRNGADDGLGLGRKLDVLA